MTRILLDCGECAVSIVALSVMDFRSGVMQSKDGTLECGRYLVAPKYEEHDMYWFIDLGTWWSMFLECPNEFIDVMYEEVYEVYLA